MPKIAAPFQHQPIVDKEGRPADAFQKWLTQVTKLDLIIGTGSPEGVVVALQGQEYMNDAGTASAIKYIKRDADIAGDASKGWILV